VDSWLSREHQFQQMAHRNVPANGANVRRSLRHGEPPSSAKPRQQKRSRSTTESHQSAQKSKRSKSCHRETSVDLHSLTLQVSYKANQMTRRKMSQRWEPDADEKLPACWVSIELLPKGAAASFKPTFKQSSSKDGKKPMVEGFFIGSDHQKEHVCKQRVNDLVSGYTIDYDKLLGQGTFGAVFEAYDEIKECTVAAKVVFVNQNPICFELDEDLMCAANEECPNLVGAESIWLEHSSFEGRGLGVIIMPLIKKTLRQWFQEQYQVCQLKTAKALMEHLLCGVEYLHNDLQHAHTDLKPDNCFVKMSAMGTPTFCIGDLDCRSFDELEAATDIYMTTRYYRAPEVLLEVPHLTGALDYWAIGCIVAEYMTGKVIFQGNNAAEMITEIVRTVGPAPNLEGMGVPLHVAQCYFTKVNGTWVHQGLPTSYKIVKNTNKQIFYVNEELSYDPQKINEAEYLGETVRPKMTSNSQIWQYDWSIRASKSTGYFYYGSASTGFTQWDMPADKDLVTQLTGIWPFYRQSQVCLQLFDRLSNLLVWDPSLRKCR